MTSLFFEFALEKKMGGFFMNKKQAGIIVALLVLIVFAGYLATKVNDPLYSLEGELDGDKTAVSMSESQSSEADYFMEIKLTRDQDTAETLQRLETLMNNENTPDEEKQKTAEEWRRLSLEQDSVQKLESKLMSQGFEDAICYIEDNKVRVIIKSDKELTDEQLNKIRDLVMSQTKIKDVEIEVKK
jgi:stage III sporulation protein AH